VAAALQALWETALLVHPQSDLGYWDPKGPSDQLDVAAAVMAADWQAVQVMLAARWQPRSQQGCPLGLRVPAYVVQQ